MSVTIASIMPQARSVRLLATVENAMKNLSHVRVRNLLCGICLAAIGLCSTGCQGVYNGQLLPSPWYHTDDIQYFPPGPEFKLSREAAAMKAYKADLEAQQGGQ